MKTLTIRGVDEEISKLLKEISTKMAPALIKLLSNY